MAKAQKVPAPDERPGVVGAPYVEVDAPDAPEYAGTVVGAPTVDDVPPAAETPPPEPAG